MSDSPEALQRRIAELEAQLRALQTAAAPAGDTVTDDKVGDSKVVELEGTVNVGDDARITFFLAKNCQAVVLTVSSNWPILLLWRKEHKAVVRTELPLAAPTSQRCRMARKSSGTGSVRPKSGGFHIVPPP